MNWKTCTTPCFLALGTYKPVEASLPGMEQGGIVPALEYLIGQTGHMYSLDLPGYPHIDLAGEQVLVLGGGDTAMDCVRTAIRQGAASVHCVYRRDQENMPGSQREVKHAMKEGVKFEFNHNRPLDPRGPEADRAGNRQDPPGCI